jgi:hypothetical protein
VLQLHVRVQRGLRGEHLAGQFNDLKNVFLKKIGEKTVKFDLNSGYFNIKNELVRQTPFLTENC